MRISFSRISSYLMCGEVYRRAYECKDDCPPGIVLLRGRSFHQGAAKNFKQKKKTGKDMPKAQVVGFMDSVFESIRRKEGFHLTKEEQSIGKIKVLDTARYTIKGLAEIFADEFAPPIHPEWVEEKKVIKIPGTDIELSSKLDLTTTAREIIDMKTTVRSWSQQKVDTDIQLTFYSLMYEAITGKKPSRIQLAAFIVKTVPVIEPVYTSRTLQDYKVLERVINRAIDGIKKGVFLPCERGHWKCNPRYCGYWYTCPYVNQVRPIISIPKMKGGDKNGSVKGQTSPGNSNRGGRYRYEGEKLPHNF